MTISANDRVRAALNEVIREREAHKARLVRAVAEALGVTVVEVPLADYCAVSDAEIERELEILGYHMCGRTPEGV